MGKVGLGTASSSLYSSDSILIFGQLKLDVLASSFVNQCHHYYTLENLLPLEAMRVTAFNHSWKYQVSYVFTPPA